MEHTLRDSLICIFFLFSFTDLKVFHILTMRFISILVAAPLAGLAAAASTTSPFLPRAASNGTIATSSGPVTGRVVNKVNEYLGIPYAQAPTGTLRFEPPQRFNGTKAISAQNFVCLFEEEVIVYNREDYLCDIPIIKCNTYPLTPPLRVLLVHSPLEGRQGEQLEEAHRPTLLRPESHLLAWPSSASPCPTRRLRARIVLV